MKQCKSAALTELTQRGFIDSASSLDAIDEMLCEPTTFYIGFDPTAPSLHVGNLVCIMAMRVLQRHGHRPIVVIGSGTARVGDPSGKSETRRMLDEATIERHVARIAAHFDSYLDMSKGHTVDNWSWLGSLGWLEVLRDIGPHFTVNRMIATKTYRERLDAEEPLSFLEFNYQLLQAYDFARLYREHGCTLQLGGSDQWGNMVAGVELIRRLGLGKAGAAHCLTFPLLTTAAGRKMGKTEKGAVWLAPDMCSAFDYYQFWISCDDRDVRRLLGTFTDLPLPEIDELCKAEGAALRDVKARLAFEATKLRDGEVAALQAQAASMQAFCRRGAWDDVPRVFVDDGACAVDVVVAGHASVGKAVSRREAHRLIEAGAVRFDDVVAGVAATVGHGAHVSLGKKLRFVVEFRQSQR